MKHMRHLRQSVRYGWPLRWEGLKEDFIILAAWMLPRSVAYWAVIRLAAPFGVGPDDITVSDVLKRHQP